MKTMLNTLCISGPALLLLVTAAQAAEPPVPQNSDTRAWLDLQISGSAAAQDERPMPGEIADRVYQRYVDSYAQPIPETLKRDNFVSSGNDGG
jgi:hypothetical protein